MLAVSSWTVFSLVLLIVMPDRWDARREIAKRQRLPAMGISLARNAGKGVPRESRDL